MPATVTAPSAPQHPVLPAGRSRRSAFRTDPRYLLPAVFTALNAVAFFLVRPDVNDLAAARARSFAVADGVGLTYWFSWFGGGSTPGNYSVVTPTVSAVIGSELLGALAAIAVTVLGTILVRGTRYPFAGACVVALAASINLWSGRIPFLFGGAIAIGALLALKHGHRVATVGLTLVSILASPLSGAFIAMGLSGTFLTTRTKAWRPIIAWAVGAAGASLIGVALVFGTPGPEPFSRGLALETLGGLLLLWLAKPPDHVRTTIVWSVLAVVVLYSVPNGMGSNFARFVWFCLPAMVLSLSRRRLRVAALIVAPVLIAGLVGTLTDLRNAVRPVSSAAYYEPLAHRLDKIGGLQNYRVEVVNHGAHAGYDALLGHAMLARGWETQEDNSLNRSLMQDPLDPLTYKIWLDNNAVGYVALPSASVGRYPEYDLVKAARASYLDLVWHTADWQLFRVSDPTPIVAAPARILDHTQSRMTVQVPCICTVGIRVRWSKFLDATLKPPAVVRGPGNDSPLEVRATVLDDGSHWTTITTTRPGTYILSGNIRGFLR